MAAVTPPHRLLHDHANFDKFVDTEAQLDNQRITQHLQTVYHLLRCRPIHLVATISESSPCVDTVVTTTDHLLLTFDLPAEQSAAVREHLLPPVRLTAEQAARRSIALHELHAYMARRQYPAHHASCSLAESKASQAGRLPAFIDSVTGVHCAVGHTIAMTDDDGATLAAALDRVAHTWTVQQMVTRHETLAANQAYLDAVSAQQQAVLQLLIYWQQVHGFTLTELACIQPTYPLEHKPRVPRVDAESVAGVAALQLADGSFPSDKHTMIRLTALLRIRPDHLPRAATTQDERWEYNKQLLAILELRCGMLPEYLPSIRQDYYPQKGRRPYGCYQYYDEPTEPAAVPVLQALYAWVLRHMSERAAAGEHDSSRATTINLTSVMHTPRYWAVRGYWMVNTEWPEDDYPSEDDA